MHNNTLTGPHTQNIFLKNQGKGTYIYGLILAYGVIFSAISIFRLNTFQLEYDLAVFIQDFWTTLNYGDLFYNSLHTNSQFGIHFSPIIILILPFFALVPGPEILLIVQSFLLGLGALPLYWYCRDCIDNTTGIIISATYLLYPALHGVNLYDFHEICFVPSLIGMTIFGLLTKRGTIFIFFAFLSLLIREDVTIIVFMTAVAGFFLYRQRDQKMKKLSLLVIILSLIWFFLTIFIFIPGCSYDSSQTHDGFINQYFSYKDNFFPLLHLKELYIFQMLSPVCFLSLLSPEIFFISIPSWIEILFAPRLAYFSIYYQYSALLIPIIFFSLLTSLTKIKKRFCNNLLLYQLLLLIIIFSSCISAGINSPAMKQMQLILENNMEIPIDHRENLDYAIMSIPEETHLSTQYNVLPFAAKRKNLTVDYNENADYLLIDHILFWRTNDFLKNTEQINNSYILDYNYNGIQIWKKKFPPISYK